jgi:tetratricopeptide (TPR) repeat protein
MPDHALEQLAEIDDPQRCPFEIHQLRGEAFRDKKEHRRALDEYHQALSERPTDLWVLMGLAWCYKRVDQLPRAIAAMEEAYQAHPQEPIVLYNLSCYFALAGRKAESLSWLGRALRMESGLRQLIPAESDFALLRDDPDFRLVAGVPGDVSKMP